MSSDECAICSSKKRNLKSVTNVDDEGVTYFTKLQYIAPEVLWKNDSKMCGACITDLKVACKFREQCVNVTDKLKDDEVATYLSSLVATQTHCFDADNGVKYEIEWEDEPFEQQYFMCYHCGKQFTKESSIKKHLEVCDGNRKVKKLHQCEKCQKLYRSAKILQAHKKTCVETNANEVADYECPECFTLFKTAQGFENHMKQGCKREENGTSYFCKRCNDIFDTVADLKDHLLNEHNEVDYQCEICDKVFENDNEYMAHKAAEHKKRVIKRTLSCQECSAEFKFLRDLLAHCANIHSLNESSIKPYSCKLCPKRFHFASSLRNHNLYHEGNRTHVCIKCGKNFVTKRDLNRHEVIHYDKKNHHCEKCGKGFNTTPNLNTHILIMHTDPKLWQFVCEFCGKRSPLKGNHEQHKLRHTGERNFVCHLCEKPFITKKELQVHVACHSDVKSHVCDQCGKAYRKKYDLDVHRKRDHGLGHTKVPVRERKFACHICPKRFHARNKLTAHLCVHSGLRPFSCRACGKKFTTKSHTKEHLKNVHQIYNDGPTSSKIDDYLKVVKKGKEEDDYDDNDDDEVTSS